MPASALPDVIRVFGEHHDGIELLTEDELARLNDLVSANPGLEVTPNILLGFIRALAGASSSSREDDHDVLEDRGDDDMADNSGPSSRSSSRGPSTLPSTPGPAPKTPNSARFPDSPFESARRRRTAPLTHGHAAPSSWNQKRVGTTTRRRSDASNYGHGGSDSEVCSGFTILVAHVYQCWFLVRFQAKFSHVASASCSIKSRFASWLGCRALGFPAGTPWVARNVTSSVRR